MEACRGCGLQMTCAPGWLCHDVDANGERVLGSGCYGVAETADNARLDSVATAVGCKRDEVTPNRLAAFGEKHGVKWDDITPEKATAIAAMSDEPMVTK